MKAKKPVKPSGTDRTLLFEIKEIPLSEISSNREFSYRRGPLWLEGLRDSIRHSGGQKMEIAVRPEKRGKYQIIYGFRRVEALEKEGQTTVLAKVYSNLSDEEALRLRFAENTGRQDYTPYEIVMICRELKERFKYSDEEIGRIIGRNRVSVNRYLAIARSPRILKRLQREEIGFKEAYQLATRAEEVEKMRAAASEEKPSIRIVPDLQPKINQIRKVLKESFPGVSVSVRIGGKKSEPTLNIFGIGLEELKAFLRSGEEIFQPLIGE